MLWADTTHCHSDISWTLPSIKHLGIPLLDMMLWEGRNDRCSMWVGGSEARNVFFFFFFKHGMRVYECVSVWIALLDFPGCSQKSWWKCAYGFLITFFLRWHSTVLYCLHGEEESVCRKKGEKKAGKKCRIASNVQMGEMICYQLLWMVRIQHLIQPCNNPREW